MVDRTALIEMLDTVHIDDLEALPAHAQLGAHAEQTAQTLYEQIAELAEEERQDAVLEVARHPATRPLLGLLSETAQSRAELYLREAERWEARRREINARRLAEARHALDGLDLELARGLVNRIDGRFLSDEQAEKLDQLLLAISARALDAESLDESTRRLVEQYEPPTRSQNRPWWRRLIR